jgi:hypothetical protein
VNGRVLQDVCQGEFVRETKCLRTGLQLQENKLIHIEKYGFPKNFVPRALDKSCSSRLLSLINGIDLKDHPKDSRRITQRI